MRCRRPQAFLLSILKWPCISALPRNRELCSISRRGRRATREAARRIGGRQPADNRRLPARSCAARTPLDAGVPRGASCPASLARRSKEVRERIRAHAQTSNETPTKRRAARGGWGIAELPKACRERWGNAGYGTLPNKVVPEPDTCQALPDKNPEKVGVWMRARARVERRLGAPGRLGSEPYFTRRR